jgi:3-phosphoshikimate 1-carboxyvinyltransferase
MMSMESTISPVRKIEGQVTVPGDLSIAHRALFFASLTENAVEIEGLPANGEIATTMSCLKKLGVEIEGEGKNVKVKGKGLHGFQEPDNVLDVENSAATACLLAGLLAGQPFYSTLTGGSVLRRRSLQWIIATLQQMGATVSGRQDDRFLPLTIRGYDLLPVNFALPEPDALLKSALLTAALYSRGVSEIIDPYGTRDHTERALCYLGAGIKKPGEHHLRLHSPGILKGEKFCLPGDFSAAAFFMAAAAMAPDGELYVEKVGVNPTRTGFLTVLRQMGARVNVLNDGEYSCELVADLHVKGGKTLTGLEINREMLPRLVEEIPVLMVVALAAAGNTIIKGISLLRHWELERLQMLARELRKMGAVIEEFPDRLVIRGGAKLAGARCISHGDHSVAMALSTAALFAESESVVSGKDAVQAFFPDFFEIMAGLGT